MPRYTISALLLLVACARRPESPPIRVVDFVHEFDRAEKRPADAFQIAGYPVGADRSLPSIVAAAPSRIIWILPLPGRGVFDARVALAPAAPGAEATPLRFRMGVSDNRIYEALASVTVHPGDSAELRADLSAYAGWKWSLFYHPDRIEWRVVLSMDALSGAPARGVWIAPGITADTASALEYRERRGSATRNAGP